MAEYTGGNQFIPGSAAGRDTNNLAASPLAFAVLAAFTGISLPRRTVGIAEPLPLCWASWKGSTATQTALAARSIRSLRIRLPPIRQLLVDFSWFKQVRWLVEVTMFVAVKV